MIHAETCLVIACIFYASGCSAEHWGWKYYLWGWAIFWLAASIYLKAWGGPL